MAGAKYYISKSAPITEKDLKPTHAMGFWMERVSAVVSALDSFSTGGTAVSATDVEQGLVKTVNELVDERITYRSDGLPDMIESLDIETGAVIATEEFEYSADGLPARTVEKNTKGEVTTNFTYEGVDLRAIEHEVALGGFF